MSIFGTCKVCNGDTVNYCCSDCDAKRIAELEAEVERLRGEKQQLLKAIDDCRGSCWSAIFNPEGIRVIDSKLEAELRRASIRWANENQ